MSDPLLLTRGSSDVAEKVAEEPLSSPDTSESEALDQPLAPQELGRVVDPLARDAAPGARALLRLEISPACLERGGTLRISVPERLVCGRCEGGGCEGCANSGAVRVDADSRSLEITLAGGAAVPKRLRLEEPFGEASPIRQILIDLVPRTGAEMANVRWIPRETELSLVEARSGDIARPRPSSSPRWMVVALVVVAVALALAVALSSR